MSSQLECFPIGRHFAQLAMTIRSRLATIKSSPFYLPNEVLLHRVLVSLHRDFAAFLHRRCRTSYHCVPIAPKFCMNCKFRPSIYCAEPMTSCDAASV